MFKKAVHLLKLSPHNVVVGLGSTVSIIPNLPEPSSHEAGCDNVRFTEFRDNSKSLTEQYGMENLLFDN